MFLQSWVVPVVLYTDETGTANVKEVIGTAFFINTSGLFLTCKHVTVSAYAKAADRGFKVGLVVKGEGGTSQRSFVSPIATHEHAPQPYDVALGKARYTLRAERNLILKNHDVMVWQKVATYGYPLNAVSGNPESLNINIRAHAGIVQRVLSPGDLAIGESPAGYELSFLIGTGISGAPLFIHEGATDTVIGICTNCTRTEEIDEVTEVVDGEKTFRETKLRISEHGIAHDLISLRGWKPALLDGKTLSEAAKP